MTSVDDLVPLLEALHAEQEEKGWIGEETIRREARRANRSPTELWGALTAYPRLRLGPGPIRGLVCRGPACRLRGETRTDLDDAHCVGLCDQPGGGPVVLSSDARPEGPPPPGPRIGVPRSAFFGDDDPLEALSSARGRSAEDLVSEVTRSGLAGRGGAGFPAGRKWSAVRAAEGTQKLVVCNADESEPGTFKDRALLEWSPARVLAGMAIAAHAVGARAGIVYVRWEYRRQRDVLQAEIARLRALGLLGESFDVAIRRGAGLYVCGEESALLSSLEGCRPMPRNRPPYPAERGLLGAPTLVQNVETLAAIPAIVSRGAAWFAAVRPKLYCVSGDVPAPGVFELSLGVTERELVELAGGDPTTVTAFTLGGISGGLLPGRLIDLPLDLVAPRTVGAALGSGATVILGPGRCPLRLAADAMAFYADESCGKCFPCRIGTTRLREGIEGLLAIDGDERGVPSERLIEVCEVLDRGSACALGSSAAQLGLNLTEHFADELSAHAAGRCAAPDHGRVD